MPTSAEPKLIATVIGKDGYETCYVGFQKLIARDKVGLSPVPTVTPLQPNIIAIADGSDAPALNTDSPEINGKTYAPGEVLIFKAKATGSAADGSCGVVRIDYETTKTKSSAKVKVCRQAK